VVGTIWAAVCGEYFNIINEKNLYLESDTTKSSLCEVFENTVSGKYNSGFVLFGNSVSGSNNSSFALGTPDEMDETPKLSWSSFFKIRYVFAVIRVAVCGEYF
jgi:hypothetical protein